MDADDRFEIEDVTPRRRFWFAGASPLRLAVVILSIASVGLFAAVETLLERFTVEHHEVKRAEAYRDQARSETARLKSALKTLRCEVWSPGLDVRGVRDACGVFRGQPFEVVCGPKGWCEAKRVVSGGDGLSWGFVRFEPGEPCDPELSRFLDAWFANMKETDDR